MASFCPPKRSTRWQSGTYQCGKILWDYESRKGHNNVLLPSRVCDIPAIFFNLEITTTWFLLWCYNNTTVLKQKKTIAFYIPRRGFAHRTTLEGVPLSKRGWRATEGTQTCSWLCSGVILTLANLQDGVRHYTLLQKKGYGSPCKVNDS